MYEKLIEADLRWAKKALEGSDDFDINISAYHAQQALEKTCGYISQKLGIKSPRTHDIAVWIELLESNSVEVPEILIDKSDEITAWESKSRYNINFITAKKTITNVLTATEKLLETVKMTKVKKDSVYL